MRPDPQVIGAAAKKHTGWGFLDLDGSEIGVFLFEEVNNFTKDGIAFVRQQKKWAIIRDSHHIYTIRN